MRKILISILVVLLIILTYFTIFQGISIGKIQILSTKGIIDLNNNLTNKIAETNEKKQGQLQGKKVELSESVDDLLKKKKEYFNLANISTESEISKANAEEVYNIVYLYLRIGRHARAEGVIVKMVIQQDNMDNNFSNITFTATGKYVGIIDFISALEDDSELNFKIDNFKLIPDGENLQATFNVNGIRIKLENTTQTVEEPQVQNELTDTNNDVNTVS